MKDLGLTLLGFLAVAIFMLGTTWIVQGNEFFMYKYFAPRTEQVRREVFEQTKSYQQGTIQELENYQAQYITATPEQQKGLRTIILHRADSSNVELPPDLKQFIDSLRSQP